MFAVIKDVEEKEGVVEQVRGEGGSRGRTGV